MDNILVDTCDRDVLEPEWHLLGSAIGPIFIFFSSVVLSVILIGSFSLFSIMSKPIYHSGKNFNYNYFDF